MSLWGRTFAPEVPYAAVFDDRRAGRRDLGRLGRAGPELRRGWSRGAIPVRPLPLGARTDAPWIARRVDHIGWAGRDHRSDQAGNARVPGDLPSSVAPREIGRDRRS